MLELWLMLGLWLGLGLGLVLGLGLTLCLGLVSFYLGSGFRVYCMMSGKVFFRVRVRF